MPISARRRGRRGRVVTIEVVQSPPRPSTSPSTPTQLPDALPVLPLKETVAFPNTMTPLAVGQERSVQLVNDALGARPDARDGRQQGPRGRGAGPRRPLPRRRRRASIARMLKMPDGTLRILVQGGQRVRIDEFIAERALPRRAHPRGARHRRALVRARGAHAPRPDHLLEHHRGRPLPARGAPDRGRERRRPRGARPHDRRLAADQDRGEAGAARGARTSPSACAACRSCSRASWR